MCEARTLRRERIAEHWGLEVSAISTNWKPWGVCISPAPKAGVMRGAMSGQQSTCPHLRAFKAFDPLSYEKRQIPDNVAIANINAHAIAK